MYIPLDRLYHFIEKLANEIYDNPVIIYRFWPHGSKKIQDINPLKPSNWAHYQQTPGIWCHDQEPLDTVFDKRDMKNTWNDLLTMLDLVQLRTSLKWYVNIFKKNILLHSEKRSYAIEKCLEDGELIPVYYWSHAVIARDWFRYAKHEAFKKNVTKQFLIYNRAWSGTREYRLKFSDLLVEHGLVDHCRTFCSPIEDDRHYTQHNFHNNVWRPTYQLENYLPPSLADSCASADFDTQDYQSTEIEVVLETLFDDDRLHLTEKSLRPIACRQPFILVATHGSLQYLQDYGFKTFDTVWDESYDRIQDPVLRMQAIIDVMRDISAWSAEEWIINKQRLTQIAEHNQKHFFSDVFSDQIITELRTNMKNAFAQIKEDPGFDTWIARWQARLQHEEVQEFMEQDTDPLQPNRHSYERVLKFIADYSKSVENDDKK